MLTFLELKQKSAELTQHVSYDTSNVATYDANFLSKIGTWLNLSQKRLAEKYDFWVELQAIYNFNTADGTEAYSMPTDFDKPFKVFDLTNEVELTIITEEEYATGHISDIVAATEGEPTYARIYGVSTRLVQMKLGLIPGATYSMRVLYKQVPTDMSADDSYPFMDADRYLIMDACGFAFKWEREEQKAVLAWQMAEDAYKDLMTNQMRKFGVQQKFESSIMNAHR